MSLSDLISFLLYPQEITLTEFVFPLSYGFYTLAFHPSAPGGHIPQAGQVTRLCLQGLVREGTCGPSQARMVWTLQVGQAHSRWPSPTTVLCLRDEGQRSGSRSAGSSVPAEGAPLPSCAPLGSLRVLVALPRPAASRGDLLAGQFLASLPDLHTDLRVESSHLF